MSEQSDAVRVVAGGPGLTDKDQLPSPISRKPPDWLWKLRFLFGNSETPLGELLYEIYEAVQGKQHRLALMGIRAFFEQLMIAKVGYESQSFLLKECNIRTRIKRLATGTTRGGIPFGRGALYYLVSNHFYIGEVKYKNEILPGEQSPIMDRALFDAVRQKSLAQWSHRTVVRNKSDHLLIERLRDPPTEWSRQFEGQITQTKSQTSS